MRLQPCAGALRRPPQQHLHTAVPNKKSGGTAGHGKQKTFRENVTQQASTPGAILKEDDIFFIDIALRVDVWGGDGGASFVVGGNAA